MSAATGDCCACDTPTITEVPGSPGTDGAAGAAGADGQNAFSTTTAIINLPVAPGPVTSPAVQSFVDTSWMSIGQVIFISDGTDWGHFRVLTIPSAITAALEWLNYNGDAAAGSALASGSTVSPAGTQPPLSGALPTALTDNTTGTASNTLAAGVGVSNITLALSSLATGLSTSALDLLTSYTPGYRFQILAIDWVTTLAGTGAGASQTFNLEINAVDVTGGVVTVTLASTATVGSITSGTAITAANTGSSTDTISLEMAASGTAFTAGAGYFIIRIRNLDTSDAVASLSDHVNDLITALT